MYQKLTRRLYIYSKVLKYHFIASALHIEFCFHADGKTGVDMTKSGTTGYRKPPGSAFGGQRTAKHDTRSHDMLNRVQNNL